MSTNYHTPIVAGASNAVATINTPLAGLDAALSGLANTVAGAAGAGVFTLASAATATTTLLVDSTAGFVVGADILYYHTSGTVREFNTVAAIPGATTITLGTAPGGTIADNTVIAQVVKSVLYMGDVLYNVKDFGAVGDGVADDRAAINAAITACNAAGGGTVFLPPGTYRVTTAAHPTQGAGTVGGAILLLSNVHLRGAGIGLSTIKLANDQNPGDDSWIISNRNTYDEAFTDSYITMSDFTVDGNYAQQDLTAGAKLKDQGIALSYCSYVWHDRVEVKNVYGGGATPATGEGFGFHVIGATNIYYDGCIGRGAGYTFTPATDTNTATNFSSSAGSNIFYTNCVARDSGQAMGFTNNNSTNVYYSNCISYRNRWHGFNIEYSNHVRYSNCLAGGLPAMSQKSEFGVVAITAITKANPGEVTATAHGFVTNDKIYIGGNRSVQGGAAGTEVQGMHQINGDVYTITKVDADKFTVGVNTSSYGTYTSNGLAGKSLGNYYSGWNITDGRDVSLVNCDAIANGTGATRSGVAVKNGKRITITNGSYRHNTNFGIDMTDAEFGAVRLTGNVHADANDAFSGIRVASRSHTASTTIGTAGVYNDSSIVVVSASGFSAADTIHIQLDNGGWHITTIASISGTTVNLDTNLPYAVSIGNAVYLHQIANVAIPSTGQLSRPATNPADGVTYTNHYPFPVLVIIRSGTVSQITINTVAVGLASGQFTLQPGGTIMVNQTVNPTWFWLQAG